MPGAVSGRSVRALIRLGLRVDVDTLRGTGRGVPGLLSILNRHGVRASFFFSAGPDNMGRNLWRMLNPSFVKKMLRSKAPALYGLDILLMGTAWPGPMIGPRCRTQIKAAADAGHEIGLHAWDHFTWQHRLDAIGPERMAEEHRRAHDLIAEITGAAPVCAAAPGWKVNPPMLEQRERFQYCYASDCRGESIFRPELEGRILRTPQIPATLPTFDELAGAGAVTAASYNDAILGLLKPGALNVHTIHAEVEGIARAAMFDRLLASFKNLAISACPLGELLPDDLETIPAGKIERGIVTGRADWVSVQRPSDSPR